MPWSVADVPPPSREPRPTAPLPAVTSADSPMQVVIWGAVLLGGIAAFIAWGLTHAYPTG